MSSTSPAIESKTLRPRKVLCPKVWKRPHSTIYGKNVEFGSKLTSDKLGEINGRKFNSELPWQVRNSGGLSTSSTSSSGSQGYLSKVLLAPESTLIGSVLSGGRAGGLNRYQQTTSFPNSDSLNSSSSGLTPSKLPVQNYADLLEITNPYRYSKRREEAAKKMATRLQNASSGARRVREPRIDFYDQYLDPFNRDLHNMNESSILLHEPLLHRRAFDKHLDFNHEIGVFVPSQVSSFSASSSGSGSRSNSNNSNNENNCMPLVFHDDGRSLIYKRTLNITPIVPNITNYSNRSFEKPQAPNQKDADHDYSTPKDTIKNKNNNNQPMLNPRESANTYTLVCTTTQQTPLLPKHHCQLASSPYGQSADGRKLSLGSINPHSYRPSLPSKSSTVHASDGEEFEFQDKSSPFYTDRWAGKTIRHFDSDLYSNANLFKSMIL